MATTKTAKKKRSGNSGAAYLRAAGRKPISLSVHPSDHEAIRMAAAISAMPMSEFCRLASIEAAKKTLEKSSKATCL